MVRAVSLLPVPNALGQIHRTSAHCRYPRTKSMNSELLKAANQVIPDNGILVNLMSRRVRQLSLGHRPLVEHAPGLGLADIALTEISQKKLTFESTFGKKTAAESTQVVEFPKVTVAVPAKKKAA
jgi:DNA-directed RNA polymerase subunit omega